MTDPSAPSDVQDRRRSRDVAAASLRAVADAVHDAIGCIDEDGNITLWLGGAPALFGWTADEAIGRPMWDMVPTRYRELFEARFMAAAAGGTGPILGGEAVEIEGLRKDGTTFPAELTLSRGELDGRPIFAIALRDVSARRAAEAALALADQRLRSAFQHAATGVTMSRPDGRFLAVNPAFCTLVGRSEEELLSTTFSALTHPSDQERDLDGVAELAAGRADAVRIEKRYLRPDGTAVWVEGTVALVRDGDGRPLHYISQWLDVTERRRTARELERSNAELAQLAAVAAHDLNEPLRIVDGFLRLLEGRAGDNLDDDGRRFIAEALAGAGRMRELIDALLRYARVGGGRVQRTPVDLDQIAREAEGALAATIWERGTRVELHDLPTVDGDAALLRQVLQNLLANAVRHARPDAPWVAVSVAATAQAWEIRVCDNGPGIPPALRPTAFDLFARGEGGGTGLGLAICRRAIERHGGEIWIAEQAADLGADVRFTIPRCDGRRG